MANKLPPTSGLDYEAVITEIDNQEELKKETTNAKDSQGPGGVL